jgi:hypothetical protein
MHVRSPLNATCVRDPIPAGEDPLMAVDGYPTIAT